MNETPNPQSENNPSAPENASAPEHASAPEKAAFSNQKKNALLRYMAILFGVAFLMVLLSFLIQLRDSSQTISQLNQSNASALQNAGKLQEENQALTAENEALNQQVSGLTDRLKTATSRADVNAADLQAAKKELSAAQAATQAQKNAYEFLSLAAQYRAAGDGANCLAVLSEFDRAELSANGQKLFDELKTYATAAAQTGTAAH